MNDIEKVLEVYTFEELLELNGLTVEELLDDLVAKEIIVLPVV